MIKKEAEKRITQEICTNKITPILSELGFKYLKSKSLFKIKGEEVDLELNVVNGSGSVQLNSKNEFQFKFRLQPVLRPAKFTNWYGKQFKNKRNFSHSPQVTYNYTCPISQESLSPQDFFEPLQARTFKSFVSSIFGRSDEIPESEKIENLQETISREVLPLHKKFSNLEELALNNLSGFVKYDILYYLGKEKEAKEKYLVAYQEYKEKIAKEENLRTKSHFLNTVKEMTRKFKLLFNEPIGEKISSTSIEITKEVNKKIAIGDAEYQLIGCFSKIFPPCKDMLIHTHSIRIIHDQNKVTHWDFNLEKTERPKVDWSTPTPPPEARKLIPPNTFLSAQSLTKDEKFLFVGGYNTKSYLINTESLTRQVLWAHETFKEGYKDKYNKVYNNFGVFLSRFLQNDKYLLACADHAKNVVWEINSLKRFELELPHEFTFEGAPKSTEFANDVRHIETFNMTNNLALIIRNHALIFDTNFKMISKIENVNLIRISDDEKILGLITTDDKIEIYQLKTTGDN